MARVYLCQDNITGLYSALYDAWLECRQSGGAEIELLNRYEERLFCEYIECQASEKKAAAIHQLLMNHLGEQVYRILYYAALSYEADKGNAIWGTMLAARRMTNPQRVMDHLTEESVKRTFELYRQVSNESHFFKEILRFKELESGILYAKIAPKSQVLTTIAPHFENRLPLENWMIYDETHHHMIVHEKKRRWIQVLDVDADSERFENLSQEELEIERLWKGFFTSISIKERESRQRQLQHFPIWYRKNAVEFESP